MFRESLASIKDCNFLSWVGLICLAYFGFIVSTKIVYIIRKYICSTAPPNFSQYGKWSVVTGATDGIGKAIAFELASKQQNIILIARNQKKLENVAAEIESTCGVKTAVLEVDFDKGESIYKKIQEFLNDFDIGILVNNVGAAHDPQPFLEITNLSTLLNKLTKLNVVSVLKMHEIMLPRMVKEGRGLILNISSACALRPTCYFAAYGATKAFIHYFSLALNDELEDSGVTIQSVLPFTVSTNMSQNLPVDNIVVLSPANYAKALLTKIGKEVYSYGAWQHAIQGFIIRHMPNRMFKSMMKKISEKLKLRS